MRTRILYPVLVLVAYLNFWKFSWGWRGYKYASMLVHAMVYLEGQVNCKKTTEYWHEHVWHQRLIDFLNHGKFDLNSLNDIRITHLLPLALKREENQKDLLGKYVLLSVDTSPFEKFKNKKSQGVNWTGDEERVFLAHSMMMSSFIYGQSCVPFKKILYWGRKRVPKGRQQTKAQIHIKLARKSEKVKIPAHLRKIAVFDGEGCTLKVLPYFHKNPEWAGFVTKFPRTRNITLGGKTQHIKKYLSELSLSDFVEKTVLGKTIHYHTFTAEVPSLSFLGMASFVVVLDKPNDLSPKNMRVLITNIEKLPIEEFLAIYLRRWKQETYHQILKDRLGVKSYKHRRLKAVMRFLELGDIAYSFLEYRRLKTKIWQQSLSEVRNHLLDQQSALFSKKCGLNPPKPLCRAS